MEFALPHYESYAQPSKRQRRSPKPKASSRRGNPAERKRTVKYLSVCRDPKVYNSVVKSSPDSVIKSICDAALNVQRGDRISLNKKEKALFRKHHVAIGSLASKKVPLARKRKLLTQEGGAFFIPALIGAALSGLGSLLFGKSSS